MCLSLAKTQNLSFLRKTRTLLFLLEQNVTKNTHAKEDVFHFDSLRFADDGFCAQKDRRELARVQVRVTVRMMSLFTRNFVSFFFFFFNIFSPLFGCKWNREDEALWMWSLSLVGCASILGIDWSDHERRKRAENERWGRRVVLLLLFGRTDAFARCSIERGGVLIPSSLTIMTYLLFVSKWISFETRFDSMLFTTMMMIKQTERSKPRRRRKRNSPRSNAAGRKPATRRSGKMPRRRRKLAWWGNPPLNGKTLDG